MQEAIHKVIEYGFEIMKLQSMDAVLHPDNERSILLLKRTGFNYDGELENDVVYKLINPLSTQSIK
jgi:[ribosomal protein S5]-alanine N-acetyltransferase